MYWGDRKNKQQEGQNAQIQNELREARDEICRQQDQARMLGGLYQQAVDRMKAAEARASQAEHKVIRVGNIVFVDRARLEDVTRGLAALSPIPPTDSVINDPSATPAATSNPTMTDSTTVAPNTVYSASTTIPATNGSPETTATSYSGMDPVTIANVIDDKTMEEENNKVARDRDMGKETDKDTGGFHNQLLQEEKGEFGDENERVENEEVGITDNEIVQNLKEDEYNTNGSDDSERVNEQAKEIEPGWKESREEEDNISMRPKAKQDTNAEENPKDHQDDNNTDAGKEEHEVESNTKKDAEPGEGKQHIISITEEKEKHELEDKEKDVNTDEEIQPLNFTHEKEKHETEGKEKDIETDEEKQDNSREEESQMEVDPSRAHPEVPVDTMMTDSGNDIEGSERHARNENSDSDGNRKDETLDSVGGPEKIPHSVSIEVSDAGDKAGGKVSESIDTAENKNSDKSNQAENRGSDTSDKAKNMGLDTSDKAENKFSVSFDKAENKDSVSFEKAENKDSVSFDKAEYKDPDPRSCDGEEVKKSEGGCAKCSALTHVLGVVGSAVDELDTDLGKQGNRINRLLQRTTQECDNCIKYQVILWTLYARLDNVDKYTHLLGDKIDDLSRRYIDV